MLEIGTRVHWDRAHSEQVFITITDFRGGIGVIEEPVSGLRFIANSDEITLI